MKALGYINLFWLHEFMDFAIRTADSWYRGEYPERCDWEDDNYVLGFGERSDLFLQWFIQHGLLSSLECFNQFQIELVLDALATVIAYDDPSLWKYVNYFEHVMGNQYTLSDNPASLFSTFFDILSLGKDYSLADFEYIKDIKYDEKDKLDLYKYC